MPQRRRATAEFESTNQDRGRQTVTLQSLTGGLNSYTDPTLLSPQMWAAANNVYSGLFGTVRRARWAPTLNNTTAGYTPTTVRMSSMYGAYLPLSNPWWFFDTNMQIWYWDAVLHRATQVSLQTTSLFYLPTWNLTGPFMRLGLGGMIFQTNGMARSKIFNNAGVPTLELDGIDAPDAAPIIGGTTSTSAAITAISRTSNIVTLTAPGLVSVYFPQGWITVAGVTDTTYNSPAGTAFKMLTVAGGNTITYAQIGQDSSSSGGTVNTGITKNTGRSYQYAWENANTGHVSAPSPASQYIQGGGGLIEVATTQPGTVTTINASPVITGSNTFFSQAWVGRKISMKGNSFPVDPYIVSVQDATHLTVNSGSAITDATPRAFFVYDPQVTHVRIYATSDGGAIYFRIARNSFTATNFINNSPFNFTSVGGGVYYNDTDNSEPPNGSFTSELTQNQNVPPPITQFQDQYQGRRIVYGTNAAPQSFFYSNMEATVVGQPPESFAPLNEITLPIGDGAINGSANLPTGMCFWSNRHDMFRMTGLLTDNLVANPQQLGTTIQRLPYLIGAASPYATCVTSLGAFWLSSDREVWLFTDHYAPKNVGIPIQNILNQATRIQFARMKCYKSGGRNWLALAITIGSSTFNNQLCLLDLDLLASNGQPSFFTFDMATNAPSWYLYTTNCEAIETAFDSNSINHLIAGDVDVITDLDWQPSYYTVATEQSIPSPGLTLHAVGNQDPETIKTGAWMRVLTNQSPLNFASQGWSWNVLSYDDDKFIMGVNANTTLCVPGVNNPSQIFALERSPALFKWGGVNVVKGRRFQIGTTFPSTPGFYELKGFEFAYDPIAEG
jgi:hypothetical protein